MIICKKCHKAIKSETATEFCKCCYPEPATKESSQYKELADYNRPRQHSESNEEQIIKLHPHDNSSN